MRRLSYVVLLVGLCAAVVFGAPQQGAEQRPTISVETNLVMLPVTVVDRRGEFVPGLASGQFTVYDNGEPQPVQFFTNEDMPATIGLVIDSSSSMRAVREQVTTAATAFAASAHPLDEMFSMHFNEAVWPGLPAGVTFATSVDQLHHALARTPAAGMTALFDAVDRALDHLALGTRDRKALILVSDGGDNASATTLDAVIEHARRSSAVIYAVAIADPDVHDARPDVLKKFAHETGGVVFSPAQVDDVMKAFARIGHEIREGYIIGISPPSMADGGFRTIRVEATSADGRQLVVRTRAGYYAGRSASGVE